MEKMKKVTLVIMYFAIPIVIIVAIATTVRYLLGFTAVAPYATKIGHIISFIGGFVATELIRNKFKGER